MKINPINANNIIKIQHLLSESAGYKVDLHDEVDSLSMGGYGYFTELNDEATGFIRAYPISNDTFLGEFLCADHTLNNLLKCFTLNKIKQRLRFDFTLKSKNLIDTFKHYGFHEIREYLHFEKLNLNGNLDTKFRIATSDDLEAILKTISELHKYENNELLKSIESGSFYILENETGFTTAATKVSYQENSLEIIEFAVNSAERKNGYGNRCLNSIDSLAMNKEYDKITLKVESTNTPAISLYRKSGYTEITDKTQWWIYKSPSLH